MTRVTRIMDVSFPCTFVPGSIYRLLVFCKQCVFNIYYFCGFSINRFKRFVQFSFLTYAIVIVKKLTMVHRIPSVSICPNRATVVGDDSS